jgi:quercetin dioxygenase-like cupin family protein
MSRLQGTLSILCLAFALFVESAPGEKQDSNNHREIAPHAISWRAASPSDPTGPQIALLAGDPSKPGLFTIRLKLPAGYKVMPHWHPRAEFTTVISGTLLYGIGDKWDDAALHELPAGGFLEMSGGTHHFAAARDETIVQVSGKGPAERILVK